MGLISKPIVAKLGKKFGVRQSASEQLETGNVLIPVTIADSLVTDTRIVSQTVAYTIPTTLTSHVVPSGKRWRFVAYSCYLASGTATFDQVTIGTSTSQIILFRQTAAATLNYVAPTDIYLTEGQFIGFNMAAVTGAGNANCTLLYEEEDIY